VYSFLELREAYLSLEYAEVYSFLELREAYLSLGYAEVYSFLELREAYLSLGYAEVERERATHSSPLHHPVLIQLDFSFTSK
jgi:hypothetical protein